MAQRLELDTFPPGLPYPSLRDESVVKSLISQGRTPCIVARDYETQLDSAVCFIPKGVNEPPKTFNISIEEARAIAKIRDKLLQREH